MKNKNVWILFFVVALLLFLILTVHSINKTNLDKKLYTDYSELLNAIDDKISFMYYGQTEENIKAFFEYNNLLIDTEKKLKEEYKGLTKKFFKREISFGEYFKLRDLYSKNLERIPEIKKSLDERVN